MTQLETAASRAKLFAAIVVAQRKARAVFLDSKNEFHRYKYASAESIVDEARGALGAAGLAMLTTHTEVVARPLPRAVTSKGSREEMGPGEVLVSVTFLLVHESGESMAWSREWPACEEKGRPLDKAVAAAMTNGLAYALRDLLLLPRDDDAASMDRRDDRPETPKRTVDQADAAERAQRAPAERLHPRDPSKLPLHPCALETCGNCEGTGVHKAQKGNDPCFCCRTDVWGSARYVPPPPESGTRPTDFEGILAALERGEVEYMASTIAASSLPEDTKRLLTFVSRAYEAESKEEFSRVGAEVRAAGLPKPWIDETMTRMRPAWDKLQARLKGAA